MGRWFVVLALVSCTETSGVVCPVAAQSSVVQLARFLTAMSGMNANDAADAFGGTTSADYLIVGPTGDDCAPGQTTFAPDPSGSPARVTCDPDGCHLSYIISMSYPWFVGIGGTVSGNGMVGVSYTRSHGPAYSYGYSLTGTIVPSADRIDGTLTLESHPENNDHGSIVIRYEDVRLSGGCPVGGAIHIHDVLDVGSDSSQSGHDLENTVSAWPPCP